MKKITYGMREKKPFVMRSAFCCADSAPKRCSLASRSGSTARITDAATDGSSVSGRLSSNRNADSRPVLVKLSP